ncbi:MAG: ThiF family adenylyltransferase [Planctomycetota bacterium]
MIQKRTAIDYRLVMPSSIFQRAFALLSLGRANYVWGQVYRSYVQRRCDLIVRQLKVTETPPVGVEHSPLFDWILFVKADDESNARAQIARSKVKLGQKMVFFQPGNGTEFDQWVGAVVSHDSLQPINEVRLIGPEMPVHKRIHDQSFTVFDDPGNHHWSRMEGALGADVFRKFRSTEVLLVGAGRLGSLLATTWIRNGLHRLTIIDPDELEPHNRDSTFGNLPEDIGAPKATILVKHLASIRPDSMVTAIQGSVQDDHLLDRFRRAEIVISCVDNDQCRKYVAMRCAELLCLHLDVGTIVRRVSESDSEDSSPYGVEVAADIRLIIPGSCLNCVGGLEIVSDGVTDITWRSGGRIGSLTSINHMAVGAAQQNWFDFLAGRITSSWWQRLRWSSEEGLTGTAGPVSGNDDCSVCQLE